jgi:hypothetical protein
MLDINEYLRTEGPSEIEIAEMGEDVAMAKRLVALLCEKVEEVNAVLHAIAFSGVEIDLDTIEDQAIGQPVQTTILFVRRARYVL